MDSGSHESRSTSGESVRDAPVGADLMAIKVPAIVFHTTEAAPSPRMVEIVVYNEAGEQVAKGTVPEGASWQVPEGVQLPAGTYHVYARPVDGEWDEGYKTKEEIREAEGLDQTTYDDGPAEQPDLDWRKLMTCCESPDPALLEKNNRMFCRNCKRYLDNPPQEEEEEAQDDDAETGDAG